MRILESLRVAFGGLLSNRLRSALTMLGIVIGVAAVITLVSMGESFKSFTNSQFQTIGSNLIFIFPQALRGAHSKTLKAKPLTMEDAKAIGNPMLVSGLAAIAPTFGVGAKVVYGGNDMTMSVTGVTPSWSAVREWYVNQGQFIQDSDVTTAARVAVIGVGTVKKLFTDDIDPLGQDIRINNIPFRVIGILTAKSSANGGFGPTDEVVVIPISTAQTRLAADTSRTTNGQYRVSLIFAKSIPDQDEAAVKKQIESVLSDRHSIEFKGDEDFQVITQDQVLSILGNILGLLTIFLGLIAGISLIVGGIGVMNIMLVSVTERTREIGLRKAVGARYADLMLQFLFESIALSIGGGIIGILISMAAAAVATQAIPSLTISVAPSAILLATGVSTAIGLFFGIYPASRAASLNPIEALRYE